MKSTKRHVYGLISLLLIIGTCFFCYRHWTLDVPFSDNDVVNSWMVEANLRFNADRTNPIKVNFVIPYMPPNFAILDEYFVSYNYLVTNEINGFNRQTTWSLRRGKGPQSLYYRAIFRETNSTEYSLSKPPLVKRIVLETSKKSAVETITNLVRQSSADIQTFAQGTIKELNKQDGSAKLLVGSSFNDNSIIDAAILILNQAKIYAMPVKGIYLGVQSKASFHSLLVVYNGKQWFYLNPKTGVTGLPKNFLIWQYGNDPAFAISAGGKNPVFNLTQSSTPSNALIIAKTRGMQTNSQMLRFSLLQLPVNVQNTYKILLTVPIGAFIILILRNFIGLKTFGTFMPVLIALAFRETHVIWGITLFTTIVFFGLLARFYLDELRLLIVPRLSAILTIVIILMLIITVLSQNLGLETGLSIALFPMVILTMTIERMCITWDERGALEAIKCGVGSLLAAVIAFSGMNYQPLGYLIFAFPELLLVLLALILWFGQYRGYRLSEIIRFKALSGARH